MATGKSKAKRAKAQAKPERWTKGDGWLQASTLIYAGGPEGGMICELSEPRYGSTMVEHHAVMRNSPDFHEALHNGMLIASAPELYGALKDLLTILTKQEAPAPTPFAKLEAFAIGISALINLGEVIERAEKVLQQARGEQRR